MSTRAGLDFDKPISFKKTRSRFSSIDASQNKVSKNHSFFINRNLMEKSEIIAGMRNLRHYEDI